MSGEPSLAPAISANGAAVSFTSRATDLVAGQADTDSDYDVFLFDRASRAVSLVSHAAGSATTTGNGFSCCAALSADGTGVAYLSTATNLVTGQVDANTSRDAFVFDRTTGQCPAPDEKRGWCQ